MIKYLGLFAKFVYLFLNEMNAKVLQINPISVLFLSLDMESMVNSVDSKVIIAYQ